MVKQCIRIAVILMFTLITTHNFAKAEQKHPTVEELFGSYRVISFVKVGYCYSTETRERAEKYLSEIVKLQKSILSIFGGNFRILDT
jgi:hypothetical protein